ncbi:MAG TPA: DUF3108 domain-containing protein [Firmicutes bacterium]|jgi:hypothetical protein|nr:DUF3108 domain-containing protein [Bacillota bacterium]HPT67165.1 DUF3108 domain-containing protein [Bacillota bacterium]
MKRKFFRIFTATVLLILLGGNLAGTATAEGGSLHDPLTVGERLTYKVYFAGIAAGTQTIEVKEKFNYQGYQVYRIKTATQSSGVAKLLYKYDEEGEFLLAAEGFYPLYSRRHVLDKGKDYKEETYFQLERKQAVWERVYKDGQQRQELFSMPKPAQDGMSITFYFRSRPWERGAKEFLLLTNRGIKGIGYAIDNEPNFKSALGVFAATRISYEEQKDGEQHKYTIWYTKDRQALPLRILVKKNVTMDARLVRVEKANVKQ